MKNPESPKRLSGFLKDEREGTIILAATAAEKIKKSESANKGD